MAVFDPTQFPELREVFTELTPVQFETAMLFALGLHHGDIARLRSVSYQTTHQTLDDIKVKMGLYSLSSLLSICQVRLVFYVLESGRKRNGKKVR